MCDTVVDSLLTVKVESATIPALLPPQAPSRNTAHKAGGSYMLDVPERWPCVYVDVDALTAV